MYVVLDKIKKYIFDVALIEGHVSSLLLFIRVCMYSSKFVRKVYLPVTIEV